VIFLGASCLGPHLSSTWSMAMGSSCTSRTARRLEACLVNLALPSTTLALPFTRLPQNIFCPRAPIFGKKLSVKECKFFATFLRQHCKLGYFVCHGQSVSVMESFCPSRTVCVCHGQSVSITDILCLSQNFFLSGINTFLDNFRAERRWKIRDFGKNCP